MVELTGSYRQMGRQYGTLLRGELGTLYRDAIEDFFVKKRGFSEDRLRTIAKSLFDLYPRRYKEILYGMAETSGLGIEKHILGADIRAGLPAPYGVGHPLHCSAPGIKTRSET